MKTTLGITGKLLPVQLSSTRVTYFSKLFSQKKAISKVWVQSVEYGGKTTKTISFSLEDLNTEILICKLRLSPMTTDLPSGSFAFGRNVVRPQSLKLCISNHPFFDCILYLQGHHQSKCSTYFQLCNLHLVNKCNPQNVHTT